MDYDVTVSQNHIFIANDLAELVIMDIYHDKIDIHKSADEYNIAPGEEVTYTLTLHNTSPNTLTNLALSDPVPLGTTYIEGGAYDPNTDTVSWTFPEILPDQIIERTFRVRID